MTALDGGPPLAIRLTPAAGRQLSAIRGYIAREGSVRAADAMAARLLAAMAGLADAPLVGRKGPGDTRELTTVRPYIVRYRVSPGTVTIIRIRHGARRPTD